MNKKYVEIFKDEFKGLPSFFLKSILLFIYLGRAAKRGREEEWEEERSQQAWETFHLLDHSPNNYNS